MDRTTDAFAYLESPAKFPHSGLCCLCVEDSFLAGLVQSELLQTILGDDANEVPVWKADGTTVEWRDVADQLSTLSLFGSAARIALITDADDFVTNHRSQLEDWVAKESSSILILVVTKWPKNTKLAKATAKSGLTVFCRVPKKKAGRGDSLDLKAVLEWAQQWAATQHGLTFQKSALQQLWEISNQNLGMVDQSMAKLALLVTDGKPVTEKEVVEFVGGWQLKTAFDLTDAMANGDAAFALQQLDYLLQSGQHPNALFGAISWSLRRFADATRSIQQQERQGNRANLNSAVQQAGVPHFQANQVTQQLKQIGRHRASQMHRWLLELDLSLKGSHSSPHRARHALETLIIRLAASAKPPR